MITEQAARTLVIQSAIESYRPGDGPFWYSVVTRIVYDLDEAGNADGVNTVKDILGALFRTLPGAPGMSGFPDKM